MLKGPKGNGDMQAKGTKGKWRYASSNAPRLSDTRYSANEVALLFVYLHFPLSTIRYPLLSWRDEREMEICKQQSETGNGDMQAAKRDCNALSDTRYSAKETKITSTIRYPLLSY